MTFHHLLTFSGNDEMKPHTTESSPLFEAAIQAADPAAPATAHAVVILLALRKFFDTLNVVVENPLVTEVLQGEVLRGALSRVALERDADGATHICVGAGAEGGPVVKFQIPDDPEGRLTIRADLTITLGSLLNVAAKTDDPEFVTMMTKVVSTVGQNTLTELGIPTLPSLGARRAPPEA